MRFDQDPPQYRPRTGLALPLILAGAAFVMVAYLVWERAFPASLHGSAEPRPITPRGELSAIEQTTIAIYEANRASVVHITSPQVVTERLGYVEFRLPEGTGSGFVWDERGYVVTNYHVVRGRNEVMVRLANQREYAASVVGVLPELDIAVVKIDSPPSGLRPVLVGSSSDLKVGQMVLAIGNPFGLDHTLTTGVISALDRSIESLLRTRIEGVIQVDAAINPGNSGGPLLDSHGRLIGMNTAIHSPSGVSAGIGFAVPVNTINRWVPQLIRGEPDPERLVLGIDASTVPWDGRSVVQVKRVSDGSGAAAAGLLSGDVIVAIDGKRVSNLDDIAAAIANREPGDRVPVTIWRGLPYQKEELTVDVELKAERTLQPIR